MICALLEILPSIVLCVGGFFALQAAYWLIIAIPCAFVPLVWRGWR